MELTLLLDLDDTLLNTNMDAFVSAYFAALANHLSVKIRPEIVLAALRSGNKLMLASQDPAHTLQEVFETEFYSRIGHPKAELVEAIDDFYETAYPALQPLTKRRRGSRELVEAALAKGFRVAIATDPIFPRMATYHRIRWAGLEPEQFELVSSFETFHFTKSQPAYFAEVLGRLGWPDGPVLVVGNDMERDITPARRLGLAAYQVNGRSSPNPLWKVAPGAKKLRNGQLRPWSRLQGKILRKARELIYSRDLMGLHSWLDSADLTALQPSPDTEDAMLSTMTSTPAVLHTLSSIPDLEIGARGSTIHDRAMIELICHLRDIELDVYQVQIRSLMQGTGPFIHLPDRSTGTRQRKYRTDGGPAILSDFTSARISTLRMLKHFGGDVDAGESRFTSVARTDLLELAGVIAHHDRMHIRQAWNMRTGLL